jgi:hypothetical protein
VTEHNGELVARSITADDLRRIPPASSGPESSGPDAARAAAEEGPGAGEGSGPSSSSAPPPPLPSGGGAILALEMALALTIQQAAKRAGVPFRDVAVLAKLTRDERELLEPFAPYAARYLGAAGELSPVAGLIAFGLVGVLIVSGRMADVRAIAPERPRPARPTAARTSPASNVSREPPPKGARVVDVEHAQRWGKVADVVEPGTQVRDSGAFPPAFGAPA